MNSPPTLTRVRANLSAEADRLISGIAMDDFWRGELSFAMRAYFAAQPEHKASAATMLKQTIIGAHSHGSLPDDAVRVLVAHFGLQGD